MDSIIDLLPAPKTQLAGDLIHLRKLWIGLQRTSVVVQQALIAYGASRQLLERIDGAPSALVLSDIHIPEQAAAAGCRGRHPAEV
jgi:hypothetical protein